MVSRSTWCLVIAVVLIAVLLFVGCSSKQEKRVRLAYQISIAASAVSCADAGGFLEEEGLMVESQCLNSGPPICEALGAGTADIGAVGNMPAIVALSSGVPAKIVAVIGGGERRERLMVPLDSTISSFNELAGKKVALKKGSSGHFGFYLMCRKTGLNPDMVTLIDLSPSLMADALAGCQVDAILSWEPTPTVIESLEVGREVLTLEESGSTYPLVVLASERLLESDRDLVFQFLSGVERAAEFINSNPDEAAKDIAAATGLAPEVARKSMDYHFFGLISPETIVEELQEAADFLVGEGLMSEAPDINDCIWTDWFDAQN